LNQEFPEDFENRVLNIRTSRSIKKEAKKPWDVIDLEGRIGSNFIYSTALAKNILPFTLHNPLLVVLPVIQDDYRKIQLFPWEELKNKGYLDAANWFRNVENLWDTLKTEKNRDITYLQYLNWLNKLENQDLNMPYVVIYNASAKDANALVVDREKLNLPFVVDYTSYYYSTKYINEAYFLSSCLNCNVSNKIIKPFQAKGLFGARHVSKKILDIPFPRFDPNDNEHLKLAEVAKTCSIMAGEFIESKLPRGMSGVKLGKARLSIRRYLKEEMAIIDRLVEKIVFK